MQSTNNSPHSPQSDRALYLLQAGLLTFASFICFGALASLILIQLKVDWTTFGYGTLGAAVSGSLISLTLFWKIKIK